MSTPMPEPLWPADRRERPYVDAYSHRQMVEYGDARAAEAAAEMRERAARVCTELDVSALMEHPQWLLYTVELCNGLAVVIRALDTQPAQPEGRA